MDKKVNVILEILKEMNVEVKDTKISGNVVIINLQSSNRIVIPLDYSSESVLKKTLIKIVKGHK